LSTPAHDAFVGIDRSGRIVEWNAQACATFGWTRAEAIGRSLTETIIPPDFRAGHTEGLRRFHATGEAPILNRRLELRALHRSGREFPVELTVTSPLKAAHGPFFGAFLRDISDRLAHDAEIRNARDVAEQSRDRLDRELAAAGLMQRMILPPSLPEDERIRFAATYQTSRHAGGDYYDVIQVDRDRFALVVVDVSGHGANAAIVMAMIRAVIHTYPGAMDDPVSVLQHINRHFQFLWDSSMFATAIVGVLDAGSRVFRVSSAGHTAPLLIRAGQVTEIPMTNAPLLLWDEIADLPVSEITLEAGDRVVLYTDGITDRCGPNDSRFDLSRVMASLAQNTARDMPAMLGELNRELDAFACTEEPDDDQTVLGGGDPDTAMTRVAAVTLLAITVLAQSRVVSPALDEATAGRFAALALACVQKEYPNKIAHVLNSPEDVKAPHELTPSFLRLLRLALVGTWALAARATGAAVSVGRVGSEGAGRPCGEHQPEEHRRRGRLSQRRRPRNVRAALWSGMAAAARGRAARVEDTGRAAGLVRNAPLEAAVVKRLRDWIAKLAYPIREASTRRRRSRSVSCSTGAACMTSHSSNSRATACSSSIAAIGTVRFRTSRQVRTFSVRVSRRPTSCAGSCRPPSFPRGSRDSCRDSKDGSTKWLPIGVVTDKTDGKLAHLDGLNLSRAWMLEGIAGVLSSPEIPGVPHFSQRLGCTLTAVLPPLRASTMKAVTGSEAFATYLVTKTGR
jgi:PAS domain S-box-containing protein